MQLQENIALAQGWLLHSGIQAESGAFNTWFDLGSKSYPFAYSEITGYAMTALVFLDKMGEGKGAIERAEKAAAWLKQDALSKEGAIKTRQYYDERQADERFSFNGGNVFAFDCGMVLNGFVNLFNATGKKEYLRSAEKIAGFLCKKMFKDDAMHAVYNLKRRRFLDSNEKWSWQPGSCHAKIAIGLLDLAAATGKEEFAGTALQLCENAVAMQEKNGRFVTNKSDKSTHLHPHCYSAEGLLYAGIRLQEQKFIEAAKKAIEWPIKNMHSNGGMPPFFNGAWNENQRSDVIAQVLRLCCALHSIDAIEKSCVQKAELIAKNLAGFQNMVPGEQQGGFFYGKELDGSEKKCLNSWCTLFALQAMHWFNAIEENKKFAVELII